MAEIKRDAAQAQPPRPKIAKKQAAGSPAGAAANAKKKKKKISLGFILFLLFVLIIGGAVAAVYFDMFGVKDMAVMAFGLGDPTAVQISELQERIELADRREAEAALKEAAAAAREEATIKREKAVAAKEAEVIQREAEAEAARLAYEGKAADIASTALLLAGMDAASAAEAIGGLEKPEDIARVLLNMEAEKAAIIMDAMESELKSTVLQEMIKIAGPSLPF